MKRNSTVFQKEFYLTDGGLETSLIYHQSIPLEHFAAFSLLSNETGRNALENYYHPYLELAIKLGVPFVLESPTWRSNTDWGFRLGYTHSELFALNKQSIYFMRQLAAPYSHRIPHIIISGNIGPRSDGYKTENKMSDAEAKVYHLDQIKAFAFADADLVTAATLNYSEEAIGIIHAARSFGLPVVISFTVETNGRLPSGESLEQAIETADAATNNYPEHYMINCAHPQHFISLLDQQSRWTKRIAGIRANASVKSHAELNCAIELDAGDEQQLAIDYANLFTLFPHLKVAGGCCGTDHRHLAAICKHLFQSSIILQKSDR